MHLHELMAKVAKLDNDYQIEHGTRPSRKQLASMAGITLEKLAMLTKVRRMAALVKHDIACIPARGSAET